MTLSEWFVGLLEPPHEPYEHGLALCGLLLLAGFVVVLLRAGRRSQAPGNPSYALRYKRHLHNVPSCSNDSHGGACVGVAT